MSKRLVIARAAIAALTIAGLVGIATRVEATDAWVARAIEGVWEPVVTIRDCQTGDPLFSFLSMDSYIRGGSLVAESASEPNTRATGLGSWRHAGGRHFTAKYQFFTYNLDGTPSGRLKVSTRIRLGADGSSFVASDTAEVSDLQGNVLAQVCGTRRAKRME
jgi:hypothetical protein